MARIELNTVITPSYEIRIPKDANDDVQNSIFDDDTTTGDIQKCSATLPGSGFIGGIVDSLDGESKDGKISNNGQGATGDCWLLAGVNALSYCEEGREIIKNALDYQNGYTIVHTAVGDIEVSDDEIAGTKGSFQYSSGDDDMIIFELAIEKILDKVAKGELALDENAPWYFEDESGLQETKVGKSSTDGGFMNQGVYFLTGHLGQHTSNADAMNNLLDQFESNNGEDFVLTCAVNESTKGVDVNGKKVNLPGPHAYSIKKVEGDNVTVINPWNSSKELVFSREEFLNKFNYIQSVDLKDENNKQNIIKDGTVDNYENIDGTQYVTSDIYQNGQIVGKTIKVKDSNTQLEYKTDDNGNTTVEIQTYDENGNIRCSYRVSQEEAQNILDRKLLESPDSQTGVANDIFVSELASIDDEQWDKVKILFNNGNYDPEQVDLQAIGKIARMDDSDIEKTIEFFAENDNIDLMDAHFFISLTPELYSDIVEGYDYSDVWKDFFGKKAAKKIDNILKEIKGKDSAEKDSTIQNFADRDILMNINKFTGFRDTDFVWLARLTDQHYQKAIEYLEMYPDADAFEVQDYIY